MQFSTLKHKRIFRTFLLIVILNVLHQNVYSLDRAHTPVILKGADIPAYLGLSVDQIRAYRYTQTTEEWDAMPFQVDELDNGIKYGGAKNNLLDADDELVFLDRDAGDKANSDQWPMDEAAQQSTRIEVRVNDSLIPGQPGYIYLFLSTTLNKTTDSYFEVFNQPGQDDWVHSPNYTIVHGSHGLQGSLYLNQTVGGDSIDFMDRQKFRIIGRIFGINEEFAILEKMDGPISLLNGTQSIHALVHPIALNYVPGHIVRLHRYVTIEYHFSGTISIPIVGSKSIDARGTYDFLTTFYPTFSEWSAGKFTIPEVEMVDIKEVRFTTDLNANAYGMVFYNPYNNPSFPQNKGGRIDEHNPPLDYTLPWPGNSWNYIVADPDYAGHVLTHGTIVNVTQIPQVPQNTSATLYYMDAQNKVANDTGDNKSYGDHGILAKGNSIKGDLDFHAATYYLPENLSYAEAENIASQHLNPLTVQTTEQVLTFTLTAGVTSEGGGTIQINPDLSEYVPYSTVTLTATPNSGYDFSGWDGDLKTTTNPVQITLDASKTITARFTPKIHQVTITTDPPGHPFTVSGTDYIGPENFEWIETSTHTISVDSVINVSNMERILFQEWNGIPRTTLDYLVTQDDQLTATFRPQYQLRTSISPTSLMGYVKRSPALTWFNPDESVTITPVSRKGYSFSHWSGDISSTEDTLTIVMHKPYNVIAHFLNIAPIVQLTDTSFSEDDSLTLSLDEFYEGFDDDATPDNELIISFENMNHILINMDTLTHQLSLSSIQPDWYGADTLTVTATDEIGAKTSAQWIIHVTSVPDPPSSAALLNPPDEYFFTMHPDQIEFAWRASTDRDPEDTLTYSVTIDTTLRFDSPLKFKDQVMDQEAYLWNVPNNYPSGIYYWHVLVTDIYGLSSAGEDTNLFYLGNEAPVITMPDTSFMEDDTLKLSLPFFFEYIADDNSPDSLLNLFIKLGEQVNVSIHKEIQEILLTAKNPNWFGSDTLQISAEDPMGAIGKQNWVIKIISQPDRPEPFALVRPADGLIIYEWPNMIQFEWEMPMDPDPMDTLIYTLQIDTTAQFNNPLIQVHDLKEPAYLLEWPDDTGDWHYYWRIIAVDRFGLAQISLFEFNMTFQTAVSEAGNIPTEYELSRNYPNPFNSQTTIQFGLPARNVVDLAIYNMAGQHVRQLISESRNAGYYTVSWDGKNDWGRQVSSGLYIILLRSDETEMRQKALLIQ